MGRGGGWKRKKEKNEKTIGTIFNLIHFSEIFKDNPNVHLPVTLIVWLT